MQADMAVEDLEVMRLPISQAKPTISTNVRRLVAPMRALSIVPSPPKPSQQPVATEEEHASDEECAAKHESDSDENAHAEPTPRTVVPVRKKGLALRMLPRVPLAQEAPSPSRLVVLASDEEDMAVEEPIEAVTYAAKPPVSSTSARRLVAPVRPSSGAPPPAKPPRRPVMLEEEHGGSDEERAAGSESDTVENTSTEPMTHKVALLRKKSLTPIVLANLPLVPQLGPAPGLAALTAAAEVCEDMAVEAPTDAPTSPVKPTISTSVRRLVAPMRALSIVPSPLKPSQQPVTAASDEECAAKHESDSDENAHAEPTPRTVVPVRKKGLALRMLPRVPLAQEAPSPSRLVVLASDEEDMAVEEPIEAVTYAAKPPVSSTSARRLVAPVRPSSGAPPPAKPPRRPVMLEEEHGGSDDERAFEKWFTRGGASSDESEPLRLVKPEAADSDDEPAAQPPRTAYVPVRTVKKVLNVKAKEGSEAARLLAAAKDQERGTMATHSPLTCHSFANSMESH